MRLAKWNFPEVTKRRRAHHSASKAVDDIMMPTMMCVAAWGLTMTPVALRPMAIDVRVRAIVASSSATPTVPTAEELISKVEGTGNKKERKAPTTGYVNRLIVKATDSKSILKLVDSKDGLVVSSPVNVATALHKLASINKLKRAGRDALIRDKRFDMVSCCCGCRLPSQRGDRSGGPVPLTCIGLLSCSMPAVSDP